MPKRSNQFQRAIAYIAEKLAPSGATVRESVELPERGLTGVVREVDTLIEAEVGITLVRVALESRDGTRKDPVAWIDELIGKYSNLAVDRVLAVSSSAFSAVAKAKAALNGIDLLTPEDVEGIDWPARFEKLGVAAVFGHAAIEHVEFATVPPFAGQVDVDRDTVLREVDGERVQSTVRKFIEELAPIMTEQAKSFHTANYFSVPRTRADLEIPLFDQRQAQIAKLEAHTRQAESELHALAIDVRADVRSSRARVLTARGVVQEYGKVIVPLRESVVRFSQEQYDAMLIGVYQLIQAKQNEFEAYREYIESLRDYWIARSDLERAVGARVGAPAPPPAAIDNPTSTVAPPPAAHQHH